VYTIPGEFQIGKFEDVSRKSPENGGFWGYFGPLAGGRGK
jgi:hypothetical protein